MNVYSSNLPFGASERNAKNIQLKEKNSKLGLSLPQSSTFEAHFQTKMSHYRPKIEQNQNRIDQNYTGWTQTDSITILNVTQIDLNCPKLTLKKQ